MANNPLLVPMDQPIDYARIEPAHIEAAIPALIDRARQAVDDAARPDLPLDWEHIIEPLLDATEPLSRAWSIAGHLNAVVNTPELRDAFNACLPQISQYGTWVGLHRGLYEQYQRLANAPIFATLSPARQRIIELALRDFRLSGVELPESRQERFRELSEQQALAAQKFSENVLDSIDQWSLLITDESRLDGLPDTVKAAAAQAARDDGEQGWKLVLQMPCYLPVMQYASDRELRHDMYRAYATVASELGQPGLDNSGQIETLLALRAEEASLLDFKNFAELQLETRMADSAEQVTAFLTELADRSLPYARQDLAELQRFAQENLDLPELQPWDVAFASEQLRQARYAYSEEEIKQYFTEPQVVDGLFATIQTLFGVTFREVSASTWHADVRAFEALRPDGSVQGLLYMDLFARQGKRSGAWVSNEHDRRRSAHGLRTPVVYLTCNFTPAQGDTPALLTHDDVITLFHESGHMLHCLLSRVDDPGASAFAAVEWDAIELPSQFMENFCWEWSVVQTLSRHVDTGEPLPRERYDRLVAARNFQSGMQMVRQIEFALFDMLIHGQVAGLNIQEVLATLTRVREQVAVVIPPEWHRFPHQFSHLFAGGYAAGYYSYKWAEVLSADAYAAFEEQAELTEDGTRNTLDEETGKRFLDEILSIGGTRSAAESFQAFRGREPSMDALLRHHGMAS
ncbi:MAG TPA: M3 family metallopeptidase [Burkholderiaceae bacterium]|nr:M3 family metallopeptidase [Burkholderiaceae bacterium]